MEHNYSYIYDGMNAFEKEVKRWLDFFLATVCLIIFSPLFLVCYIAVKRGHDGPVIFKQERIGRFGRPFYIYKFRSMTIDAESDGPQLSQQKHDKRLTKAGRFLRAHHLDELPQLWIDPRYAYLYQIRPGITSMATLYNGYTDTMEKMLKRLEMDLDYLEHRSWWLDAKILGLTFLKIVFGRKI